MRARDHLRAEERTRMPDNTILVLNSGSSSLKFGVYRRARPAPSGASPAPTNRGASLADASPIYRGEIEGIGGGEGKIWLKDANGKTLEEESRSFAQQSDAAKAVAEKLAKLRLPKLDGIGHRVVHGGPSLTAHQRITPQVLQTLEAAAHFAPLHVPAAIALIREIGKALRRRAAIRVLRHCVSHHDTRSRVALPLPKQILGRGNSQVRLPRAVVRIDRAQVGRALAEISDRRASRQRRQHHRDRRRKVGRYDDGAYADRRHHHGHASRRPRSRRAAASAQHGERR